MTLEYDHPDWRGETVFILGGGPSLRGFDAERLRGRRVIAVNEAGLSMCPWADIMFWADLRFAYWNLDRIVHENQSEYRYTCQKYAIEDIPRARYIQWQACRPGQPGSCFSADPEMISGFDGGSRCINLAYHTGARYVVLLGFDMHDYPREIWQAGNWHTAHKEPPLPNQRAQKFIPAHNRMAAEIARLMLPFEVINATAGSALKCWTPGKLEDWL